MHHEESNRWHGNMCTVTEVIFHHVQQKNHGAISNPSPQNVKSRLVQQTALTDNSFLVSDNGRKVFGAKKKKKVCSQLPMSLKLDLVLKQIPSINLLLSELILLPKQLTTPHTLK